MGAMPAYHLPRIRSVPELCLAIARERLRESDARMAERVRLGPNGGNILSPDPEQRSMQAALVATEFATAFIESMTWLAVVERFGPADAAKRLDRGVTPEQRLLALGISDSTVSAVCPDLRIHHKELYHGKPSKWPQVAQLEARRALMAAERVAQLLTGVSGGQSAGTSPT